MAATHLHILVATAVARRLPYWFGQLDDGPTEALLQECATSDMRKGKLVPKKIASHLATRFMRATKNECTLEYHARLIASLVTCLGFQQMRLAPSAEYLQLRPFSRATKYVCAQKHNRAHIDACVLIKLGPVLEPREKIIFCGQAHMAQ